MSDEPVYEYRNAPEKEKEVKAQLGIKPPSAEPEISINAQDYPVPHEFMWVMRGVPMGKHGDVEIPPINIPPECQHAFAVHLKLCGFEHNPEKQVIVHIKPEVGDDTPMNPGKWVRKSDVLPEEEHTISSATSAVEPDLSMLDKEHLAVLEAAIQKARIAQDMAAQADPEARKAAEEALSSETPSRAPTEAELKAAMELRFETVRDPDNSTFDDDTAL